VLIMLIGVFGISEGYKYNMGTLAQMGPGFFPVLISGLMTFVGVLIVISARLAQDEADFHDSEGKSSQWLAWGCIIASPIIFVVFGRYGGLLPATFGSVFVASLGDKDMTLKQSVGLAGVITVIGLSIFAFFLKIPFPVIRGVWQ